MSSFMPLQKILCYKQPNGLYKLIFIKAYAEEAPMELIVDGSTKYDITYRNSSGASASLSNKAFSEVYASHGSVDQYCQCIDEGFYHELPDVVRDDEADDPHNPLHLVYGEATDTVTDDTTGIVDTNVTVTVDDETFVEKVGGKTTTITFVAAVDTGTVWSVDGEEVDLQDYGITIGGTGTVADEDYFTVTNTHANADEILATDILTVALH